MTDRQADVCAAHCFASVAYGIKLCKKRAKTCVRHSVMAIIMVALSLCI